mmetsp:Transcript_10792/g.16270  ORF Transcript_10792/g.16270 Transcript_10792/m.16270 type:complete len:501 (-) Transcript_10792:41-1543(-)
MAYVSDDEAFTDYSSGTSLSPLRKYGVFIGGAVVMVLVIIAVALIVFIAWGSSDDDDQTALQKKYQSSVTEIIDLALADKQGYSDLSTMVNTFGNRLSGSAALNNVSAWALQKLKDDGFTNVDYEHCDIPAWKHNPEGDLLVMTAPFFKKLSVLPLGFTIPCTQLTGEVIVLEDFDELETTDVAGKIVVWNKPFTSYGGTVSYRTNGAARASAKNAIASLTRSITPFSLYTPHTGVQYYDEKSDPIPAGAITIEDAELFAYIQNELGQTITIELTLDTSNKDDVAPGQNIVAELRGTEIPEELIVIGGHLDSWDVGTGAHDDAGGIWQCWQAMRILKDNGYTPKRTIRLVMWTSEENGGAGSEAYYEQHKDVDIDNTTFCLESDLGTLTPSGFSFEGNQSGLATVQQICDMMEPTLGPIEVVQGGAGADVSPLIKRGGVPGAGVQVTGHVPNQYFWYHHTNADTIDHIDESDFQKCVGAVASLIYVIADMDENLPRDSSV